MTQREEFEAWWDANPELPVNRESMFLAWQAAQLSAMGIFEQMLAAQAAQPAQPEGWKLVPVEPTQAMCRALFRNLIHADNEAYVIKAVMAAAPSTKEQSNG